LRKPFKWPSEAIFCFWQKICSTEVNYISFSMRRSYLGEFEEVVLLTVAVLGAGAYGVAITDELDRQTGRAVSISAVHSALHRLEEKGMLKSHLGEATAERGGRRKRLFSVTVLGSRTLHDIRAVRDQLWDSISPQGLPAVSL
jgi:PadR family transcriptional regulator PadR